MSATKKAVIFARVSTDSQTTENQTRELEAYAARMSYQVVAILTDKGVSGSKGKEDRPAFRRLLEMISRKETEIVLCWSVDRISRSMTGLLAFLGELKAKGVDLFLHQQNLDSSTPTGGAMFLLSFGRNLKPLSVVKESTQGCGVRGKTGFGSADPPFGTLLKLSTR
jgi:DNA invertase Pin-like site-specific DNA recombinase